MDTTTTTSMANPTSKRASHMTAAGYSHAGLPNNANCAPGASVRNFGTAGALSLGPATSSDSSSSSNSNAIYNNDFDISSILVKPKPYYDPADDFLMADGAQWTDDKMPVRPKVDAAAETLLSLPSSTSLPSDRTSRFDHLSLSPQSSFGVDSYPPSVDHSPISLAELNHPERLALAPAAQVRGADSSCDITGNEGAIVPFSAHTHALQQQKLQQQQQQQMLMMMVYKNNSPWPLQNSSSPSELQLRCQSGGVPMEDPCSYAPSSYDVNQTSAIMAQRKAAVGATYPSTSLRLCVICGDEASGCHYGVITCGSCKVFFKRAVEGPHNYLCAGRNDCIVDKIRRKNCPSCRLRNCYMAGMKLGGRKMKRAVPRAASGFRPPFSALMFQGHHQWAAAAMPGGHGHLDGHQHQTTLSCALTGPPVVSVTELQLHPQIISLLEDIEPDTVLSDYDSGGQADVVSNMLLSCLNRLCERQLVWIVRWSKSLPGFRNLHIDDQMTLIQYSWMHLMVFALGWRSFQNVTSEYLYFAPDLVLNQEQMKRSPIHDLCVAMQLVPQEFRKLQVTREEFLCMKVIILLTTVPLEGLKSQSAFEDMRQNYIRELYKTIYMKENGAAASSQRFYHLTKLMDAMHEIVKKMNLYCLTTFIQADAMKVEFPEMMTEVISTQLPKVLAGMVKPLLFHDNANVGRIV